MTGKRKVSLDWYAKNDHQTNTQELEQDHIFKARLSKPQPKKKRKSESRADALRRLEEEKRAAREQNLARQKAYEERTSRGEVPQEWLGKLYREAAHGQKQAKKDLGAPSQKPSTWKLGKSPSDYRRKNVT